MARSKPKSAGPDDPTQLGNYSVPTERLDGGRKLLAGGWQWVVQALVFFVGGGLLVRLGPNRGLRVVGVVFVIIGLLNLDGVAQAVRARVRRQRLRRQFSGQPWADDYLWETSGQTDGALDATLRSSVMGLLLSAACNGATIAMVCGALPATRANIGYGIFGSLLSLIFLYFLFIRKSMHYLKFGASRLVFQRIPYVLGEEFKAELIPGRSLGAYRKMQIRLRCIQFAAVPNGIAELQVLHGDRVVIENSEWRSGMPPVPIRFKLPDKKLPTAISAPMASIIETGEINPRALGRRYWELDIRAFVTGLDYQARFLVPIY